MIDLGVSKLMIIGVVALVVIGPQKLPRVARTVGNLLGRAQRYVADVKGEVSRQMELEELQKMKATMQETASSFEKSVSETTESFESSWNEAMQLNPTPDPQNDVYYASHFRPKKVDWRKRQGRTPDWYKRQTGQRTRALSGAARVAKHRPQSLTRSAGFF